MLPTIIVSSLLLAVVILIIVFQIKNKKKNKGSCGCSCRGCSMNGICHLDNKD